MTITTTLIIIIIIMIIIGITDIAKGKISINWGHLNLFSAG